MNQNDNTIKNVCVFCSSRDSIAPVYGEAAVELGEMLGQRGVRVINGAGSTGLMRIIADAVMRTGGTACGVIPRFMVESGVCYDSMTECIEVETMHERKQLMSAMSDAVVALPGGYGTLEELLEIITWRQLELYNKPVIVLNTNGFYDPLMAMFDRAVEQNFIRSDNRGLFIEARTPAEVLSVLF
ncbi:MAG: TIGR00730 family Rossman fold protein [Tannerella sp.]|jgi:uncharacterized protein (TIGR00730 family)|nr:TIGR00730 family Rossman fold protein [Tannerella sp.]